MQAQLLGYLLGALEPDEHEAVEQALAQDELARRNLELLRSSLNLLACDSEHLDPPPALALRTCQLVREHAEKPRLAPVAGQSAGRSSSWSFHDLAVAAGIVIAAGMLFLPALGHSRQQARMAVCQNNERQIGLAFQQFAQQHAGYLPKIATSGRLAFPGMYGPKLREAGYLSDDRVLLCPCCKLCDEPEFKVPTERELLSAPEEEYVKKRRFAGGSFGYAIGHMVDGFYQSIRNRGRATFALLSDSPNVKRNDRCSDRHGRCGQNVLFEDGHVAYITSAVAGPHGDNLFLNDAGEVAPGLTAEDVVIPSPYELLSMPLVEAEAE